MCSISKQIVGGGKDRWFIYIFPAPLSHISMSAHYRNRGDSPNSHLNLQWLNNQNYEVVTDLAVVARDAGLNMKALMQAMNKNVHNFEDNRVYKHTSGGQLERWLVPDSRSAKDLVKRWKKVASILKSTADPAMAKVRQVQPSSFAHNVDGFVPLCLPFLSPLLLDTFHVKSSSVQMPPALVDGFGPAFEDWEAMGQVQKQEALMGIIPSLLR